MKRSAIVAGSIAAALLIAAPVAGAAKPADAQYRGTTNGGKFVVDVDNGKVTTVQAFVAVNCQQQTENVGYEILVDGVNLGLQKHGNGTYSFKAKAKPNPRAVIKGTWTKSANKVTGTIILAASSLKASCTDNGGVGANPPIPFTATRQPS
jgi:hypothetical protein